MNALLAPLIRKTGFRYGIMLGAVLSALSLTFILLEVDDSWMFKLLRLISIIAFIYLAHLYLKKNGDGTMTFRQGVSISFWMGLVSNILIFILPNFLLWAVPNLIFLLPDFPLWVVRNFMFDPSTTGLSEVPKIRFMGFFDAIFNVVLIGLVISFFTMNTSLAPLVRKTGFRYGIMLGAVLFALFSTVILLKINNYSSSGMLFGFIPIIVFTYVAITCSAHLFFKKDNGGTMTFGQGVTISLWMSLASAPFIFLLNCLLLAVFNFMPEPSTTVIYLGTHQMGFMGLLSCAVFFEVLIGLVISIFTKKAPAATL